MMNGGRKSDRPVVPTKSPNKAWEEAAEAMEGRGWTKGNVRHRGTLRTQSRVGVSPALARVRVAARRDRRAKYTALLHHVTVDSLRKAFEALKRDASPGVDGQRWEAYRARLEENLQSLHGRLHRGAYRVKPSRRAYIPKAADDNAL